MDILLYDLETRAPAVVFQAPAPPPLTPELVAA